MGERIISCTEAVRIDLDVSVTAINMMNNAYYDVSSSMKKCIPRPRRENLFYISISVFSTMINQQTS